MIRGFAGRMTALGMAVAGVWAGAAMPAQAYPHTGLYFQPTSGVTVSLWDGALQGTALLGGTQMPFQLLDLAARLPVPLAIRPFNWPARLIGMVGYRQQSSDRGDTVRGLDMGVQATYQLYDWLGFHGSFDMPLMVHGSLAGANTGISPLVLPRINLGASFELPAGPTAIVGLTAWSYPDPLLRGGVFPGNLGWQPGLLIGMNWGGPKFGDPLIPGI
jgi:hypothetical protein